MNSPTRPPRPQTTPATFSDLIAQNAAERADTPAMLFEDQSFTYAQMSARANQTAHALIAAGIVPGDRVCHIGKNDPRYFDVLGGCARSGAVLSPISWRLAPPEMSDLVNDFDIRLVFLSEEMAHVADHLRTNCPGLTQIIGVDTAMSDTPGFDDW
ncbi:MAG: AMP-binding protein, partial [Pseudomonadota bacterium]|nr:AMP-binding protein [Pseudomonadota bacterium]